jgi:alkylhydroperoxidase family enzyme
MRKGLTEDEVQAALGDLDAATMLPAATVAALRLVDRLTDVDPRVGPAFYRELRGHFDDGEILALGAVLAVASGWQRFIEAFGLRPDGWTAHTRMPWQGPEPR